MRRSRRPNPLFLLALVAPLACSAAPPLEPPPPAPPPATAPPVATPPAPVPATQPPRADANLLPRSVLFGNPERIIPKISPDGKQLAFVAPDQGVLNVWVGPAEDFAAAKPMTKERTRGITQYHWTYTGEHLLYLMDKGGDENFHVHAVNLKSGEIKDLTPYEGIRAQIVGLSRRIPGEILLGLNDRDKKYHDLYRVDIKTGQRKLVLKNEQYAAIVADNGYKARLGMKNLPDGGLDFMDLTAKEPRSFIKLGSDDTITSEPIGFDDSDQTLYFMDSRGRDTTALVSIHPTSGAATVLAQDAKADISMTVAHPRTGKIQAAATVYQRRSWQAVDKAIQADLDFLKTVADGELTIISRSLDDGRWTVAYTLSDSPVRYYRYDRAKKKAEFLFTNQKALESAKLAKMHPVVIKSRDGLDLVSYITLPPASDPDGDGKPAQPQAVVLLVHGGPWGRDHWGLSPYHQWLASRGYGVLSVNYRGSTGFGKKFVNLADREWAGRMHDDLLDAVKWAVDQRIANEKQVAIMGGSYGGYATLVGLTFTPEKFACGVDIVGPSNLVTLLQSIPPYWQPMLELFAKRVGDPRTDEGKKLLLSRSPLTRVSEIRRPLLIGQGANDPRVKQAESDQIVKAMHEKRIPVTYVLFPDEGHGFNRPENRLSFNAVAEIFLAQCLGGPYQPIGQDFKGASIKVPAGAGAIHSLPGVLPKP